MTGSMVASQLGARMHYAVPRILQAAGYLEHCYTDICATQSWPRLMKTVPAALRPAFVKRLAGRLPTGVPPERLTTFPRFGLHYALRRSAARTLSDETAQSLWAGQRFSELVISRGFGKASAVFGYSGECFEQLVAARRRGLRTVVEQVIAPREIVDELLLEECEAHGDWRRPESDDYAGEYADREKSEWQNADLILCGSSFVRDGVIGRGGAAERCVVVPYGIDAKGKRPARHHSGPLRVLSVGEVGLRKGSPYVVEASRKLKGRAEFRMVGACAFPAGVRSRLEETVELVGAVPRSEIHQHFAWADVFLLPSICEGSATAVYEALGAGLPVICTENTGSVVRHGTDGFIVPLRDANAIAEAIERLASDRELRMQMGANATGRATEFSVKAYGTRLLAAVGSVLRQEPPGRSPAPPADKRRSGAAAGGAS